MFTGFAMQIGFQLQYRQLTDRFSNVAKRQVPFLASMTINRLAQDVQDRFTQRLPVVFDRPTPFTQRSVFMKSSDKHRLLAEVFFPESHNESGKAMRDYLRPGVEGASARHQKKTEYLLSRMGFLPPGWVTIPGTYTKARLDGFGNVPGSYYKQVIRDLQIKTTKGPPKPRFKGAQSRALKMGVESEFFAVAPGTNSMGRNGGWLPSGIYKRQGRDGRVLLQYFRFVRKASYKKRFDMQAEALAAFSDNLERRWAHSVQFLKNQIKAG